MTKYTHRNNGQGQNNNATVNKTYLIKRRLLLVKSCEFFRYKCMIIGYWGAIVQLSPYPANKNKLICLDIPIVTCML